ncbi:MAG: hypothetical protein PHW02_08765, partial [bacterium]|nr:hypothetical protein [bacterium]
GWDSPQIWDALGSDNFGMHFYQVGEGNNNLSVSTTDYSLTNDTLVNGPFGSVIGGDYNFHAGTMIQQSASALEVALYNTSYSMFSVSFYGPHNGRVAGTGDSSPCDDSTGQAGNTLYDGWNEGIDRALILNATYWLSIDSLDYTQTSSVDASCVSSDNVVTIRLSIANHHSYSSIAILRKLSKESSFQRAASFKSNSVIEFTDILPEEYSGTVSYKIMGINESSYEIAFFDVFVSRHSAAGKTYFAHGDFLKVNDKAGRMFVITDILGREILSGDDAALIPIKSLPSGMFFLSTGMDKDISRVLRIK